MGNVVEIRVREEENKVGGVKEERGCGWNGRLCWI